MTSGSFSKALSPMSKNCNFLHDLSDSGIFARQFFEMSNFSKLCNCPIAGGKFSILLFFKCSSFNS